jgi:hypothetical protein
MCALRLADAASLPVCADVWCYGLLASEYIDVLRILWECICVQLPDGSCRLRGINGACFGLYRGLLHCVAHACVISPACTSLRMPIEVL